MLASCWAWGKRRAWDVIVSDAHSVMVKERGTVVRQPRGDGQCEDHGGGSVKREVGIEWLGNAKGGGDGVSQGDRTRDSSDNSNMFSAEAKECSQPWGGTRQGSEGDGGCTAWRCRLKGAAVQREEMD